MAGECIIKLGTEGGGLTLYGRRTNVGWAFWSAGTSMSLDDNDDEVWRDWTMPEEPDLGRALPPEWLLLYPTEVHPEFVGWFREAYASAVAALPEDEAATHKRHLERRWRAVLASVSPETDDRVGRS